MRTRFRATVVALVITYGIAAPARASAQASGAVVRGVVVDAETNAALPFALLRLIEAHRNDQTHEDGTFALRGLAAGAYTLIAQRIGYSPREVRLTVGATTDTSIRIALTPTPMVMPTTVVTGTVGEQKAADAISPTTVLDAAALDRRLAGSLAETVSGQPGVSATSMGPATGRPVLRGLGGDRVLVLEDGQRTGDLSSTSSDHAVAVDPLTVGRVEIVRGPMSLLYGSSALGGVINAVRDEVPTSRPDRLHGRASLQGASVNRAATAGVVVELPVGPLAMRVEGSARGGSDLRTPSGSLANTDVATYGVALGLSKEFDRGYAGVAYRGFFNEYGLPGGFVGAHPGGVDISMRRHALRAVGDWHRNEGTIRGVRANAGVTHYGHDELTGSGSIGTSYDQLMVAGDVVANLGAHGPFSSGALGTRFQYRDITTGGALRTPSTGDWSGAVFAVEEVERGSVKLQGGVRGDVSRYTPRERTVVTVRGEAIPTEPRSFASLSGSLGALWNIGGGVRAGASVSRSFRTPDFNELYSDGPHLAAYSYDVGNPRLSAEHGVGLDAFVRLERANVRGEFAVFRNAFSDYIFPRNTGELGRQGERWKFQYSSRDAVLSGGEADVSWTPAGALVIESAVSLVVGRVLGVRDTIGGIGGEPDRLSSVHLPLLPPLNGRVGARWDRPRWFAGVGVRMAVPQERLGDFETRTPGYSVADAQVGVRLLVGERLHAITLRTENTFNREFREHLSRTKEVFPEAGRSVSLLYRMLF